MAAGIGGEADFHRGRRLGKYEILTRLSVGGMAELFLAYTSGPGGFRKYVALKQILPDVAKDKQFVQMFLDEARLTAAFSHANIGQVFDLGEADRELYLAMEFISGQNLEKIAKVARKQKLLLPIAFSARVMRDTCLGLHYAHAFVDGAGKPSPVIHRDVSPKNIMVTYAGETKVIDFGIAKAKNKLGRTSVGVVKGTVGYMSPEQVKGKELDGRSDLFCAGTILYELFTGDRLFGNEGVASMVRIAEEDAPPVTEANPEVPPALAEVVARSLARDRDARFATGKEMAKAIDAALGPELFDEDGMAEVMRQMFADEMDKTRALLEDAAAAPAPAPARPSGSQRRASGMRPKPVAPPSPEEMQAADAATQVPRRPSGARPSGARTPGRGRPAPETVASTEVRPQISRRDTDREAPAATELRPSLKRGRVARSEAPSVTEERPAVGDRPKRRWVAPGWIVLLLVVGAFAAATTQLGGALGEALLPSYTTFARWADREINGEPPPNIQPQALPKTALAVMQAQEQREAEARAKLEMEAYERARAELEAQRAAETPPPAPTPAPVARDRKVTRAPAPAPPTAQRTIVQPAAGSPDSTVARNDGQVEVLDTTSAKAAAKSGVGWLSVFTVPPAAVYDGATLLGTAPLRKVALPWGTYRLTVIDAEGRRRVLSAPVEKGKETKLAIRVDELPLE